MSLTIVRERPDAPDGTGLIEELEAQLEPLYPATSRHGFSVAKLLADDVAFFVLREHGVAAGCGGILVVGSAYGELKRMYVRPAFRGRGFGKLLVEHLAAYAREHDVSVLRLETGIHQHAAIGLYERMGFHRIPAFDPYTDDPLSRYYEKQLA